MAKAWRLVAAVSLPPTASGQRLADLLGAERLGRALGQGLEGQPSGRPGGAL